MNLEQLKFQNIVRNEKHNIERERERAKQKETKVMNRKTSSSSDEDKPRHEEANAATRKRKTSGASQKQHATTEVDNARKSSRIKNNSLSKSLPVSDSKVAKKTASKNLIEKDSPPSKLNAAQFLSAASLNPKLASGSADKSVAATVTANANADAASQVDLVKLSQNVDDLNKKLDEHTNLFIKVNQVGFVKC